MTANDKSRMIRLLNDVFRTTFTGGRVMMTAAVKALPVKDQAKIFEAVRTFKAFTPDNDPHGEHEWAAFTAAGHRCNFKIDYYDKALEYGSEDPADPDKTTRVLTIMLASDY